MTWSRRRKSTPKGPSGSDGKRRADRIRGHYIPRLSRRTDYRALDWASAGSQEARFRVLADNVDLAGKRLLDVGAGLGHLWEYLKDTGVPADYTGVDILPEMVERAQALHPDARFLHADIFQDAHPVFERESFDVAFCSGVFNLNLGNNHEFLAAALPMLLDLVREHVVINLLHARVGWDPQDRYFHFHPDEVLALVRPLPCDARLLDDYLPNDFTVILRKRTS